jgi:hypothetical protein
MEEMTNVNGKGWFTDNLKFPWLSVNVPVVPPFRTTDAAGTASLLSPLLILPETITAWAEDLFEIKKISRNANNARVEVFLIFTFEFLLFTFESYIKKLCPFIILWIRQLFIKERSAMCIQ